MLSSITMPAAATILIVDDYPDALDVWDLYLRASGFEVLRAEDGHAALRCATEQLPDLVVMDLELPGLSGCEVAKALREGDGTRHIPLIASTGHSLPAKLDEARRSGFDLVLIKPCDPAELVARSTSIFVRTNPAPPTASRSNPADTPAVPHGCLFSVALYLESGPAAPEAPRPGLQTRAGGWHGCCSSMPRRATGTDVRRATRERDMLNVILVLLVLLWLLGMVSSYTLGGFVHLLLLLAIAVFLIRLIQGRNPVV